MIKVVVTVQLTTRVDGGTGNNCYHVNTNSQPPGVGGNVLFSEMKIRPKDCITQ